MHVLRLVESTNYTFTTPSAFLLRATSRILDQLWGFKSTGLLSSAGMNDTGVVDAFSLHYCVPAVTDDRGVNILFKNSCINMTLNVRVDKKLKSK